MKLRAMRGVRYSFAFSGLILAALMLGAFLPTDTMLAQDTTAPLSFEDGTPSTVVWPQPLQETVRNHTSQELAVTIQIAGFIDPQTDLALPVDELLQPYAASFSVPATGQTALQLPLQTEHRPSPGIYAGTLSLLAPTHNTVLRKPITLIVPATQDATTTLSLHPAVDAWTINAVRLVPFVRPLCLRGLTFGCTLPVTDELASLDDHIRLGHLSNEQGGGLAVTLAGINNDGNARLRLDFDRRWGYSGSYTGHIGFPGAPGSRNVELTVNVNDIILWPLITLGLGLFAARALQRHIIVHPDLLKLLRRLKAAGDTFDQLRKSIHGYTVVDDFRWHYAKVEAAIKEWDQTHYGGPSEAEKAVFRREVSDPLAQFEQQIELWSQFPEKLARLRRELEHKAKPAISRAERPADTDRPEPSFFTAARRLLDGDKLPLSQVPHYAQRLDDAAEFAAIWGELDRLSEVIRDALRQLHSASVELSESEQLMLQTARHHLNSAARDLWEAPTLEELRQRQAQAELVMARDLTQRLIDPFVYHTDPEPAEVLTAGEAPRLRPLMRTYDHLSAHPTPSLDAGVYPMPQLETPRVVYLERTPLVGEQTLTGVALVIALIAGLQRYFSVSFGTQAHYLALFSWAFGTKAGLELLNCAATRLLNRRNT